MSGNHDPPKKDREIFRAAWAYHDGVLHASHSRGCTVLIEPAVIRQASILGGRGGSSEDRGGVNLKIHNCAAEENN
jgi:hypothetical protein